MAQILFALGKSVRPRQWVKNIVLFAALVFSGFLFFDDYFWRVLAAVILFSFLTAGVYLVNDLADMEVDRKHPFKRKRPIASGELPMPLAVFAAIVLVAIALSLGWKLSFFFFLAQLGYIGLNFGYNLWFKKEPILDVLSIASGFILRVYAGALVVNLHMNVWFLLTVISMALFLAVGKRQSERTLLKGNLGGLEGHRVTLSRYTQRLLDIYTAMFANTTWLTYALFTFLHPPVTPPGRVVSLYAELPKTLITEKWLMITVPLVIYGVMRYLQLIYEKNEGESPERVLLSDKPLLAVVMVWGILVVMIIYGLR